ncbi:lytic transglycosylase domain-containing protein [candidate division WOR-3 bacterium]|nr:lytic transglycosylase domain-containing protein [candidate division WOR-3 bacterium]
MRKFLLLVILIISCPRPGITTITAPDFLKEAQRVYETDPLYAYSLLKDSTIGPEFLLERIRILTMIYLDQREYQRAALLLDSVQWTAPILNYDRDLILYKTERWSALSQVTRDTLLKGIALYHAGQYEQALPYLLKPIPPHDYRMLYCARAYEKMNDFTNAYATLIACTTVNSYLYADYEALMHRLFEMIDDIDLVKSELEKLDKQDIKHYILLKIYEKQKDDYNVKITAWKLIREFPRSSGARYAADIITPVTKGDYKALGRVYYYHDVYDKAIEYLEKTVMDDAVNFYLGNIYYLKNDNSTALAYLQKSTWAAAQYYRGRIYERLQQYPRAVAAYDSLHAFQGHTKYAIRGYKRLAFLYEDLGDTLKAVQTFLSINEEETRFRAGMQLYKIGMLEKADSVFSIRNDEEFVYWRIRVRERLGRSVDDLKEYLVATYPLSYYTLVRNDSGIVFDTLMLFDWMLQLGDSMPTFSAPDSIHLKAAFRYFALYEPDFAVNELEMIAEKSPQDFLFLSRLCAQYGADKQSILYSLEVKKAAIKKKIRTMPLALFKLMYPVRYTFTIQEQGMEVHLCLAMIWQESLFDPHAHSWANARGIMQIIPPTAQQIARDLEVTSYSLYDPTVSIRFGCYYFLNLYREINSVPYALAGYNAGPVRIKRWLAQDPDHELDAFIDLIPFDETRNYVKLILARQRIYEQIMEL